MSIRRFYEKMAKHYVTETSFSDFSIDFSSEILMEDVNLMSDKELKVKRRHLPDMGMTQSQIMSRLKIKCFSLES